MIPPDPFSLLITLVFLLSPQTPLAMNLSSIRLEVEQSGERCTRIDGTIGTNSINTDTPVYTIYSLLAVSNERAKGDGRREKEGDRDTQNLQQPSSHVCLHLFQFTCRRLPRCLSAPSPASLVPRSHRRRHPLPHFHPYSPISSGSCLHPDRAPRTHPLADSMGTAQCHVTALEMYRKRQRTDNITTRLYSAAASPVYACPYSVSARGRPFDTHFTLLREPILRGSPRHDTIRECSL